MKYWPPDHKCIVLGTIIGNTECPVAGDQKLLKKSYREEPIIVFPDKSEVLIQWEDLIEIAEKYKHEQDSDVGSVCPPR